MFYTRLMRTYRLILVLLGGLVFQPAFADPQNQSESRREPHRRNDDGRLTSNEAARIAQKQFGGGRVLAVDQTDEGYRVKLLQKGDVHIVVIPSQ